MKSSKYSNRIQAVVASLLVMSLLVPASIVCQDDGQMCSVQDAQPTLGDALLQRPTIQRQGKGRAGKGSASLFQTKQRQGKGRAGKGSTSLFQNSEFEHELFQNLNFEQNLRLPTGASALFDRKFCKKVSSSSNSSSSHPYLQTNSTSGSDRSRVLAQDKPKAPGPFAGNAPARKVDQLRNGLVGLDQKALLTKAESEMKRKAPDDSSEWPNDSSEFSRSFLDDWSPSDYPSLKASLDESGFEKVAAMDSDEHMKMYVRRVADSCNLKVINDGGLNGAVAWLNSTHKHGGFNRLKMALFEALIASSEDHWVEAKHAFGVSGSNAPLDLVGYVQVRTLRNAEHMTTFVRRMIESMGLRIVDEDGFNGVMHFYAEPDMSQGFESLISDIKKAAYEHSWAEFI